ncbi:hypothetical protein [Prochlorococcus sp. MIT 1307]|uniref:hypothetical protein n=1 Tax=Prochlorococcus sp. MIT 1307 TaxID=3096219 RepID=UPI002A764E50|nr:hypothetical protein [Prochlorococcus sp. MIT 1307]
MNILRCARPNKKPEEVAYGKLYLASIYSYNHFNYWLLVQQCRGRLPLREKLSYGQKIKKNIKVVQKTLDLEQMIKTVFSYR